MPVTYDRAVTYEQMTTQNRLLAGIHAALVKGIAADDWDAIKRIIVNGGGPSAFPVGSIIYTEKGDYTYPWAVMHHGQHADGRYYMHLRVIKAIDQIMFDNPEAFFYAENGLAAGTYTFNVPTTYGSITAGDYQFTLGNAVPAGGRLGFNFTGYGASLVGKSVQVYDSANSMTVAQTATISSGNSGTSLGDLQAGGDADEANMNSLQRVCFGSNNWAQSAIRQYFNKDSAAGSVWVSSNKFDQAPTWNATQPGFMSKLPQGFIDIVNAVTVTTDTNTVFETDYTKGSSYSTKDKFWLPSRYQIFGTVESGNFSETQWDYYKGASDADRIMRDNGGTARYQFLRSPYVGYAGNVRLVNSSGALGNGSAYSGHAECPACEISESVLNS